MNLRHKSFPALVFALAGLLAVPVAAQSAVPFGSTLNKNPIDGGCNIGGNPFAPCTYVEFKHDVQGPDPADTSGAPISGVVTKVRMKAQNGGSATFHVATVTLPNPNDQEIALGRVGPGQTVNVANTDSDVIQEFAVRLSVAKGQHMAMDTSTVDAIDSNGGGSFTHIYTPPLVPGAGPRGSSDATGEMTVQGLIEPDADGDGFGDETQDQCPSQKTTAGACDTTKPSVSSLKLSRRALSFRLSEAATVKLSVQKAKRGRRVRGKCRKPTAKNRLRRRCTRYVKVKGVTVNGKSGLNKVRFSRRLSKGRYRVVAVATDAAGNKKTFTKKFRVRR